MAGRFGFCDSTLMYSSTASFEAFFWSNILPSLPYVTTIPFGRSASFPPPLGSFFKDLKRSSTDSVARVTFLRRGQRLKTKMCVVLDQAYRPVIGRNCTSRGRNGSDRSKNERDLHFDVWRCFLNGISLEMQKCSFIVVFSVAVVVDD